MKKSLIAMALMFGAVVFVMPSCGGDDDDPKTWTCSCNSDPAYEQKSGLNDEQKAAYITECQTKAAKAASTASTKGATPKSDTKATATCN